MQQTCEIKNFQGEGRDLKSWNQCTSDIPHTDVPINKETPEDLDQAEKGESKYVIPED